MKLFRITIIILYMMHIRADHKMNCSGNIALILFRFVENGFQNEGVYVYVWKTSQADDMGFIVKV
jgi:hypothetical protein